jgi:photosystem II stability/assembly factor-like uncharacterized protein
MSITSWTTKTTNNNQWYGVAYGNNTFVAVSASGTDNRVMTSTDYGETWNVQTLTNNNRNNNWRKVVFGNGRFVAISNSGGTDRVMVSTDNGETWSAKNTPSNNWISITYGDDKFVAVADNGTNRVMVSTDYGETWNGYNAVEDLPWSSITYGNNMFVAVGRTGTNRIMISSDGINWSVPTNPPPSTSVWRSVTYGQGKFVAIANSGTNINSSTSTDGYNWTNNLWIAEANDIPRSIKYGSDNTGNELFVIGGDNGQILISSDPETSWSLSTSPNTNTMQSVAYGNGTFVIVSSSTSFEDRAIRAIISQFIPIPIPRCFKSGTYILCKTIDNENAKEEIKQIKVEDLTIGTLVKTKYDGFKPIVKIITGKIKNNPQYQHGVSEYNKNQLYVCPKDNFNGLFEDLVITSNHCILAFPIFEEKKKQILEFMGDIYVTDEKYRVPACLDERCEVYPEEGTFTIYHFALEKECELSNYGVFANGLLVESASIFDVNSDGH